MEAKLTQIGEQLINNNFVRLKGLLSDETCKLLSNRVLDLSAADNLLACTQCSNSHWAYEDPCFTEVQKVLTQALSKSLGINLLTSFNSVRLYPENEILEKHLDREAAEFVLSVAIDSKGEQLWPLYFSETADDEVGTEVILDHGDAVIFRGHKLHHWRRPLKNKWQIQAFFFFVDADGEFSAHAGDIINKYNK